MLIRSSEAGCFDRVLNLQFFSLATSSRCFRAAFFYTSHLLAFESKKRRKKKDRKRRLLIKSINHKRHVQVCVCRAENEQMCVRSCLRIQFPMGGPRVKGRRLSCHTGFRHRLCSVRQQRLRDSSSAGDTRAAAGVRRRVGGVTGSRLRSGSRHGGGGGGRGQRAMKEVAGVERNTRVTEENRRRGTTS